MVRAFNASDYPAIAQWWEAQKFPLVPIKFLSPLGFIVDGLCAGFLYQTETPIAWIEWIVANPEAEKAERREALDALLEALLLEAKRLGYEQVFTSVSHPGLLERYKKHGFVITDNGVTHLLRSI